MGDTMKEDDLIKQFKKDIKRAESSLKDWRKEAMLCYEFEAGHQFTDDEKSILEQELRPCITFNRINPVVSSVSGYQINNQYQIKYLPRKMGPAKHDEIYSEAARWADDECNALDEISDIFWDALVTGIGWSEIRMDYDTDPQGQIRSAERIPPLEMGWDTNANKRNLEDAKFVYRCKWWDRKEAIDKWPEVENIDFDLSNNVHNDIGGSQTHDATNAWKYQNDTSRWADREADQVLIFQYQYYEMEPVYLVGDPQSGQVVTFEDERFKKLKSQLDEQGIKYVKKMKKSFRQAFFLGDHLLEDEESACDENFSLLCVTGKRDEKNKYWYGIVRPMIDPQRWSNKFFSEIENILTKNRAGGAFIEETALVNPRQAEEIWNDPNPLILVRDGALGRGAIMERQPINYPAGIDQLMQTAINAIPQVTGVNPELLGMVTREQPGILEMQRKRAGMTIMAGLFNSLRRFNKTRGQVLLHYLTEYVSDGRLIRITTDQGEQYAPLNEQQKDDFIEYDVVVSDAPSSPNQKEDTFAALSQVMPMAMQMGIPIPPSILKYIPGVPQDLITEWIGMIQKAQQDPQKQQAQQLATQAQVSAIKKDDSITLLNQVKAMVEQHGAQMDARQAQMDQQSKMMDMQTKAQGHALEQSKQVIDSHRLAIEQFSAKVNAFDKVMNAGEYGDKQSAQ
jgi:hypothetical protein